MGRSLSIETQQQIIDLFTTPMPDGVYRSPLDIAKEVGVSDNTVRDLLRTRGIATKPPGPTKGRLRSRRLTPAQELEVIRDYTTPLPDGTWIGADTIAARYGIVPQTISNILARHGIKRRTSKEAYTNGKRCKPIKRLPPEGVEPPLCKCGCGGHVPWRQNQDRWDIYCPGHYHPYKPHHDREWLHNAYCVENKTATEIAEICGVNPGSVYSMMEKFGIPRRNMSDAHIGRQAGENNPAWKGGVTPERQKAYKTQEWKRLCHAVDQRDKLRCQRCGKQCGRYQAKPHRHHIKPWADYPDLRLEPANVVTLCDNCHVWVHSLDNVNKEWLG